MDLCRVRRGRLRRGLDGRQTSIATHAPITGNRQTKTKQNLTTSVSGCQINFACHNASGPNIQDNYDHDENPSVSAGLTIPANLT
jgi:hypothetical protein